MAGTDATEGPADGAASSPTRKRSRLEGAAAAEGADPAAAAAATDAAPGAKGARPQVLRSTLLDPTHVGGLRDEYPGAPGYPHCVVKDVLDPAFFRALREEVVGALSANFKETDLFKLYQTGDLANLDGDDPEMAARLPHLLALREAIYSPPFRQFVRDITGCAPLTDRTDCSSNLYAQGCHLLCHDDVIGTRCISFIIYLTDPDEPWTAEDGGALEIYPLSEPGKLGAPAVQPTTAHLPLPNTMAFFTVLPGQSFHAVEEVYKPGKMRLSISGWYHAADPPPGSDMASLSQLQTREAEAGLALVPLPPSPPEDAAVRAALAAWVNPTYLSPGAMRQIRARFQEDGSVLLHGFLLPALAERIAATAKPRDGANAGLGRCRKPDHGVGYGQGWEPVGPPHKQRYLQYTGPAAKAAKDEEAKEAEASADSCPCGGLLAQVRDELLASPPFAAYLEQLTGAALGAVTGEARRFRPGLDYTLAHYGLLSPEPRLDASLCAFVEDGTKKKEAAWASGDVGGFTCYIKADLGQEGAEAAESYRRPQTRQQQEDDDDVLSVFAASNALSLVMRKPGMMRFVKFVSAAAPSSRWDVVAEYCLREQGQRKEEEEEGK